MTAKDLKNALLQEAVQGKLVPQIASEGNAWDLLEEIRKERGESLPLAPARKRSSATPSAGSNAARNARFAPITEDEIPFDIPENWCWCRLGELITFIGGYAYDSHSFIENSDYQVLRLGNVKNGYLQLSAKPVYINAELAEKTNAFKCIPNDILVTMTGTRLKRDYFFTTLITENDKNLYLNQRVGCLRPTKILCANFLDWILKSKSILDYIFEFETGTANQGNLGSENIKTIPIPLPPLAEQKRIVAAIEKFMPLIEEYGKKETELKAFNEQIGTLTKKAILQEAVQGKLVPQIAAEGNAKDLLEEIKKEKAKVAGKASSTSFASKTRAKEFPPIIYDEIPFDIPENWCWCRLGEIVYNNGQKTPDKEFTYIDIGSIDNEYQKLNEKENYIQPGNAPSRARKIVKKGDIIYSTVRPYLHNMCIIDKDFEKEPIASTGFAILACYPQISNQYLFYYLLSPSFDNYANDTENSKGVAYPAINDDRLYKGIVPLPPLAEQKRIVEAIEKMLPLCEKLGV